MKPNVRWQWKALPLGFTKNVQPNLPSKIRAEAGRYWCGKLKTVRPADFENIIGNIPDLQMSEPARMFALQMLEANKNRLLDQRL